MNKSFRMSMEDELRPIRSERTAQGWRQGKYVARYRAGANLVLLDPDVAKAFPDQAAVNEALRLVIRLVNLHGQKTHRPAPEAGSARTPR